MRILQIIQRLQLRGAEIFASQLGSELERIGVHVDYIFLFNGATGLQEQFPANNYIPLDAKPGKRFWDFTAYGRLAKIIREGNYDLVQANAGDTLKYAAISRTLYRWKAPLVYRNANLMGAFLRNAIHRGLNRWFLSRCDWFISVSENCRKDLINLYSPAGNLSNTITIGTNWFALIEPLNNPTREEVFVNIGSLVPEKNHAFLIAVFKAYFLKHGRGQLWIVGDGRLRRDLEIAIRASGLSDRVHLYGYRKDALAILKASTAMVMPSRIEGLPGVILEAFACGIPVIASATGGIPEVIEDGENGFCISGFDVDVYVECMERIVNNAELRSKFAVNGIRAVENHYLMPVIAAQFLELYQRITTLV